MEGQRALTVYMTWQRDWLAPHVRARWEQRRAHLVGALFDAWVSFAHPPPLIDSSDSDLTEIHPDEDTDEDTDDDDALPVTDAVSRFLACAAHSW